MTNPWWSNSLLLYKHRSFLRLKGIYAYLLHIVTDYPHPLVGVYWVKLNLNINLRIRLKVWPAISLILFNVLTSNSVHMYNLDNC